MPELWGMLSTSSLPLVPGSLGPGVVAPERVLSMGRIELWHLNWLQRDDFGSIELYEIEPFDHLIVCKQMTDI